MEILSYDAKVKHGKLKKGTLYFGVELEIEHKTTSEKEEEDEDEGLYFGDTKSSLQKIANKISTHFEGDSIFKFDGSVSSGFEIVTKPLTFQEQINFWSEEKFNCLNEQGFISYNSKSCGHHIHVSKEAVGPLQLAKIIKFVYSKENRRFIKKIAQREEKEYAEFSQPKRASFIKNKGYPSGKYTAVNLISANTIEFRLFRGTLNRAAFLKNLEFVDALIKFCSPSLFSISETSVWWNFINFVYKNNDIYPNLWKYVQLKEMDSIDNWTAYTEKKKAEKDELAIKTQQGEDINAR